jgi:hypothetical protein
MGQEADAFLAHYGIPGMKWGKHKKAADAAIAKARATDGHAKLEKRIKTASTVAGVVGTAAIFGTMALGSLYISSFHTPEGIARMTKGAEFIAKKANTPYSQAVVLKGAKMLDAHLGLR